MAKSENQKLVLIYLLKILMEKTDDQHSVTTKDIIKYLGENEISMERKSIYSNIDLLIDYGFDIIKIPGRTGGYYMASRDFELAELKLLVDAVSSSKFITKKKSDELIKKLEGLCSKNEARQLNRQVFVTNRPKAVNENIYYSVDVIHNAIGQNAKISFQYCEWNADKEMVPRYDGAMYSVSPWLLIWDSENYYLIGYDDKSEQIRYYRVDRMQKPSIKEEERAGRAEFEDLHIDSLQQRTFGMFSGKSETVTVSCPETMAGIMIDRFGNDVAIRKVEDDRIRVRFNVDVSKQFFGWLTGLGSEVKIELPEKTKDEYTAYLREILGVYPKTK